MRDKLENHRKEPRCAGCHVSIDPIGFGLEHYDNIGMWRGAYKDGAAINATGTLPGAGSFDGAQEMAQQIKSDPRFVQCLTRTLFSYALGRVPAAAGDQQSMENAGLDLAAGGGRLKDLVALLVKSPAFQFRGGQP